MLLSLAGDSFSQGPSAAKADYSGLQISFSRAEIVDRDPENTYILIILKIANNSNTSVRYVAGDNRELSLEDDRGNRYYGMYAQQFPKSGLEIFPGEQEKVAYAFQKPDLGCSTLTIRFPKNSLQGIEQQKGISKDDAYVKILISVKDVIVWPKDKQRHESDFKKELNVDGLIFIVNDAFFWRRPDKEAPLGITFDFINALMTTRVDVNGNFSYSLTDNLGGIYKPVRPSGYWDKLKIMPERFPRVYPGESYQETVFFQSPPDNVEYLTFTINAASVGVKKEISVKIPADQIVDKK
jgi:hypothetical protein